MKYFKVHSDQDITLNHSNGSSTILQASIDPQKNNSIYATISSHYYSLIEKYSKEVIVRINSQDLNAYNLPVFVGHEDNNEFIPIEKQLSAKENRSLKIGITTSGSQIGDSIIILSALNQLNLYLLSHNIETEFTLLKPHFGNLEELFKLSLVSINNVRLPLNLDKINQYDYIIDLDSKSGIMDRKIMNREAMIDCVLDAMGLNFKTLLSAQKNIQIQKPTINNNLKSKFLEITENKPCILFHHKSSVSLRSIPTEFLNEIINHLSKSIPKGYSLITTYKCIENENILDLSHLSKSLTDFFNIISYSSALVTVDTAAYHIANLYQIPTIILSAGNPARRQSKHYNNLTLVNVAPQFPLYAKILKLHKGGSSDDILDLWRGLTHPLYSKWAMNCLRSYFDSKNSNKISIKNIYTVKSYNAKIINRQNSFVDNDEVMLIIHWSQEIINDTYIIVSWYDPEGFCAHSSPHLLRIDTKFSYIIYLGPKPMTKGNWEVKIKLGTQIITSYQFFVQTLPNHFTEKNELQNILSPKIQHTLEGQIINGTGEASGHTLKKQLPYFIKRIPELSKFFCGTINIKTDKEVYITNYSFLFKDIEWNPNFKECFGFLQVLIEDQKKNQFPGYIYMPFRSPHYQDLFQLEILCPKIDLSQTHSLKIHFLSQAKPNTQIYIF